jgi:uncharacterized protein
MQFKEAGEFIINKLTKELPNYLTYHSVDHTKDVYNAAGILGKEEGISDYEMKLLLTAANFHDSGYLKGAKGHEEESCRIAQQALPGYEYTPKEIDIICGIIRATRIPQSPITHLEEILADADLDYFGRDDFFTISDQLHDELKNLNAIGDEDEWNELQVRFLESHHYFTPSAIKSRKAKKEENLQAIKAKLNR